MRIGHFPFFHRATMAVFLLMAAAPGTWAADSGPAGVSLRDGWMRALPGSLPSGGYFILENKSGKTVTLTGASSPACGMLMLHKTEDKGGMSSMMDMVEVPVPAGGSVHFAPGGYHLMCTNATAALKPGASVKVTLSFKSGESLNAQFAVRNAAGK
jgi:copper(I)-binding protein